jgi:hypothetical protein
MWNIEITFNNARLKISARKTKQPKSITQQSIKAASLRYLAERHIFLNFVQKTSFMLGRWWKMLPFLKT